MASHPADDARRLDILRRTRAGLEEDLDDLRAELMEQLPDYEQRLRRHTDALPNWPGIPAAQVRQLFRLIDQSHTDPSHTAPPSPAPPVDAAILGPRTLAIAAGQVEQFIERWLGAAPEALLDGGREDLARDWEEATDQLEALLTRSRQTAAHAADTLDAWLDGVLGELDARRKADTDALEELVHQGDVRRGQRARQEIADLWEEQRQRAADLQVRWRPVVALIDEGLKACEDGLAELAELLGRARQGLIEVHPGFSAQLAAPALPAPPGAQWDAMTPTLQLFPAPRPDAPAQDAAPNAAQIAAEPDPATSPTAPDLGYSAGIIPPDEPASDPELVGLESGSVSDYSEPAVDLPAPAGAESVTQRLYTRGETPMAGSPSVASIGASPSNTLPPDARLGGPTPLPAPPSPTAAGTVPPSAEASSAEASSAEASSAEASSAEASSAEASSAEASSAEALFARCFRIRPGYKPVHWLEVLGVLLPPGLLLGTMALLSVQHLVQAGENPFVRWPWAMSAVAVGFAWLLLVPVGLRWRTKWRGARLVILRHTHVREEAELVCDARGVRLGARTWRWDALERAQLRRWDSPGDDQRGWALTIAAYGAPPLQLAAPETNRKKWQNAPFQLDAIPYDAWQLDTYDFDTICRRAL